MFSTVFDDPNGRWSFYDDQLEIPLDPDAVVYMVANSSDAASDTAGTLINQIKQHTLEMIAAGEVRFPNAVQLISDIPARTGFKTSAQDAERQALNDWIYTLPGGVDGVIRIADLLGDGADPERVKPAYSLDGIHWTPAGVAVVVQQMIVTYESTLSPAAVPASVSASLRGAAVDVQAVAGSNGACLADSALPCEGESTPTVSQVVQSGNPSGSPVKPVEYV